MHVNENRKAERMIDLLITRALHLRACLRDQQYEAIPDALQKIRETFDALGIQVHDEIRETFTRAAADAFTKRAAPKVDADVLAAMWKSTGQPVPAGWDVAETDTPGGTSTPYEVPEQPSTLPVRPEAERILDEPGMRNLEFERFINHWREQSKERCASVAQAYHRGVPVVYIFRPTGSVEVAHPRAQVLLLSHERTAGVQPVT